ncbi:MAG: caspase family protein [Lewinellaceae bacterium]|nr:caspase family protein [Lewinellaceae bacterium]MCB9289181.1 caspase family protein [Lewinellaceae bacterium]
MRIMASLLFLALLTTSARGQIGAMAGKGATRAVIVGISDYEDSHIPKLHFAHRDAQAMTEFLLSDSGGKVKPEHIKMLLNDKATRGEITTAFYWLIEESKPGDRAIIYFSGHGDMENKLLMDQGYLLAYDAKASNYMGSGTFPVEMLQKVVQTLSVKLNTEVILITDACRSGELAGKASGGVLATNQGLSRQFANEVKLLSCEPDQESIESDQWGGGRGLFSYFLIQGLKGLADEDANLKVDLGEIEDYLEEEVSKRADQDPMKVGSSRVELFRVNEDTLLALTQRALLEGEAIAAVNSRGAADTIVNPLYQQFQLALSEGRLLYPENNSAYSFFRQMEQEEALQPILGAQRLNLAAALQDGAQQAINAYLEASPEEMARRWQYDESYRQYPEYLNAAAELLGSDNIFYDDLKGRQAYFEGLVLRLQGEIMPDKDSILQLALEKQELALSKDSLAAHVYNELGLIYLRLKKYTRSLEFFEQAHRLSPSWVVPVGNISMSKLDMGRIEEAAEAARDALELREDYVPPRCNLAKIAFTQGDYQKAEQLAKEAIAYDSTFTNAYHILGIAREKMNQLPQAKEAYLKAFHLNPKDALVNYSLGYLALIGGQAEEAAAYFKTAIRFHPYYADAHYNLGFIYLSELPDFPESEKYFRQYIKLRPADMEGLVLLACALSLQGGQDQALQWLEKALEGGFSDLDELRSTPFLQQLRSDPRFAELLSRYEN